MGTDDALDLVVTIAILALFSVITIKHTALLYKSDFGGFETRIEKTALETRGEIFLRKSTFTNEDALLMLVVADSYTQDPKNWEISGVNITINDSFLGNKIGALQTVASRLNRDAEMQYVLYSNKDGVRKWVIEYE